MAKSGDPGRVTLGAGGMDNAAPALAAPLDGEGGRSRRAAELVRLLSEHSGYECVALRQRRNGDYPYLASHGLPDSFLTKENSLLEPGEQGQPVPACVCGLLLDRARGESGLNGHFWCPDLERFDPASIPGLRAYRGECRRQGFRSLLLLPLHDQGAPAGMLQLADRRPGLAIPERVHFYRELAEALIRPAQDATLPAPSATDYLPGILAGLSTSLLNAGSLQTVAELVLGAALRIMPSRYGFVGFLDEERGAFLASAASPAWSGGPERQTSLDYVNGVAGGVLASGGGFFSNDLPRENRLLDLPVARVRLERVLAVPVPGRSEPQGVIVLGDTARACHTWDLDAMGHLALVCALGLGRALAEESLSGARHAAESGTFARSELLAVVSHDIKTPVTAIQGLASLLQKTGLSQIQAEYCRVLQHTAASLTGILDDILDLSRIESGRVRLFRQEFDPGELLASVCEMFAPSATEKGLRLAYELQDAPGRLTSDPLRLRQILVNLVSNAIKFTPAGEVHVLAGMHQPGSAENARLVIQVRDSGIGIASDRLEHIFESFSQADPSITARYGGSGLGLAICRRLASMMGGDIQVESEPGRGTVFTLSLPVTPGGGTDNGVSAPSASRPDSRPSPVRILLVDDDPAGRLFVEHSLRNMGHSTATAMNAGQALDLLRAENYDAVFMDLSLPDMDGLELTRLIRQGREGVRDPKVWITALTAFSGDEDRANCHAAGMDDFLTKPVDTNILAQALARAKAAARPASPAGNADDVPDLDHSLLLVRYSGQEELLEKLVRTMRRELPARITEIMSGLSGDSPDQAISPLHLLRGAAGTLGATALRNLVNRIEETLRLGFVEAARRIARDLPATGERLLDAMSGFCPSERD